MAVVGASCWARRACTGRARAGFRAARGGCRDFRARGCPAGRLPRPTHDQGAVPPGLGAEDVEGEERRGSRAGGGRRLEEAAKTGAPAAFAFQAGIFGTILDVFYVAVLVRILSSWFPNLPPLLDPLVNLARQITEPVFQPFRQLIPPLRLGGAFASPWWILSPVLCPSRSAARSQSSVADPRYCCFFLFLPPSLVKGTLVDISGIIVILLINFLRRYAY